MDNAEIRDAINLLRGHISSNPLYANDMALSNLLQDLQIKQNKKIRVCRNWYKYGHCQYGSKCWFKHTLNKRCHFDQIGCINYKFNKCNFAHYNNEETNNILINNSNKNWNTFPINYNNVIVISECY